MTDLRNIEFFNAPKGDVMVVDESGVWTLNEECRGFIQAVYQYIESNHSKAFCALQKEYKQSRPNVPYYQFRIVRRFLRCVCGKLDKKLDFDGNGRLNVEEVDCPIAGECELCNVICNPEFDANLTKREKEVMKMYMENLSEEDIASRLMISIDTVKTTKRNAFSRTGCHSLREFTANYLGRL